ncbi:MAG: hypothetical protein RL264_1723 [Bacteroidota bacterium]|jgi:tetratricopeptide (TPR) repeat protein
MLSFTLIAQQTVKYQGEYATFYRAEELFEKAQYSAAKEEFRSFINQGRPANDPMLIKAYYYEGLSALELYNNDAIPLLMAFNTRYPENIYKFEIGFKIGNSFFQKDDFESAQKWLSTVPVKEVDPKQREEFLFKLGYSALQNEDKATAFDAFRDAKDGKSQYAAPSLYFYSHLAYEKGSLQIAMEGFKKLQDDATFEGVVPYYIAQIYHKLGQYQEAIDYAPKLLNSKDLSNEADILHIIGDAHYQLGNYTEAIPYLEKFFAQGRPNRDDAYELGYCYYKTKQYEKAIKAFDRVSKNDDKNGHIAMYHIGECYQNLDKLLPARSAFERASEMKSVPEIQEDALYNFAVISFKVDINPYDESVRAFENYLSKYPNSKRKSDVYQYLVNAYTSTSNFAKALESLDNLPQKDNRLKKVYQTVAFNYGVELFQKSNMDGALDAFKLVNRYPIDPQLVALSRYWVADIYLRANKNDQAIAEYRDFINSPASNSLSEKVDAYYNIGYAYWQKEQYTEAIESFRTFLQSNPKNKEKIIDATFRVADGYYTIKNNLNAIQFYKEALTLNSNLNDKAMYYLARSYGFNSQTEEKIKTLKDFLSKHKTSKYAMNATFELAKSFVTSKNYDAALDTYQQFIQSYPKSPQILLAKMDVADIYYKKWNYAKAEQEYLSILAQNETNRNVCETCARGLMDVYNAMKQPERATEVGDRYACANLSKDEKENMFYTPAAKAYEDSLYSEAISKFEDYLQRFPTGRFVNETYFFLGNSYFRTKDTTNAVRYYEKFLETPVNLNSEYAAIRTATYHYNHKNYAAALKYYEKYEQLTSKLNTLFNARLGIMRCAFLTEDYQKAVTYSKLVLESTTLTNTMRIEAEYAKGISNFKTGNYDDAKPSLEWLVKNTTTAMGAEAKYTLAEMNFKQAQYPQAETEIKALVKMKPSYNYWVAKGLMLQSRIHIINDDLFQAEQTLKSVINHYPDQNDGIMTQANEQWDELMQLKNPAVNEKPKDNKVIEINGNK